ncbi:MAG: hypothetical protein ACLT8A_04585 [Subdoligranulum sp.]
MLDNTQSIICAFGLAAAAPRSPYRHLELCGIALTPLQSHSCRKQLDELAGNTGAAAAGTDGEGFALDE